MTSKATELHPVLGISQQCLDRYPSYTIQAMVDSVGTGDEDRPFDTEDRPCDTEDRYHSSPQQTLPDSDRSCDEPDESTVYTSPPPVRSLDEMIERYHFLQSARMEMRACIEANQTLSRDTKRELDSEDRVIFENELMAMETMSSNIDDELMSVTIFMESKLRTYQDICEKQLEVSGRLGAHFIRKIDRILECLETTRVE